MKYAKKTSQLLLVIALLVSLSACSVFQGFLNESPTADEKREDTTAQSKLQHESEEAEEYVDVDLNMAPQEVVG